MILPTEIYGRIIRHVSDVRTLSNLLCTNKTIAQITTINVKQLILPEDSNINFIMKFVNVKDIHGHIHVKDDNEFMALTGLRRLRVACINYPSSSIFMSSGIGSIRRGFNQISRWYEKLFSDKKPKNIKIIGGIYRKIIFRDKTLYLKINPDSIKLAYPLFDVVNKYGPLKRVYTLSDDKYEINELGQTCPHLETLIYPSRLICIYNYLRYTNINRVSLEKRDVAHIGNISHTLAQFLDCNIDSLNRARCRPINKDIYLETPIPPYCLDKLLTIFPRLKLVSFYPIIDWDIHNILIPLTQRGIGVIIYTGYIHNVHPDIEVRSLKY